MPRRSCANSLSRACRSAGAWAAALAVAFVGPRANGTAISEHDLKALYLYNFTQFVTWPSREAGKPFVIGIVGRDPVGESLESLVGEQPLPEPLVVRRVSSLGEMADCEILFISNSEQRRLGQILAALGERSILTVGDDNTFAMRGCAIAFHNDGGRIRIVVNERAAERAGLTLSSKLLRIAQAP